MRETRNGILLVCHEQTFGDVMPVARPSMRALIDTHRAKNTEWLHAFGTAWWMWTECGPARLCRGLLTSAIGKPANHAPFRQTSFIVFRWSVVSRIAIISGWKVKLPAWNTQKYVTKRYGLGTTIKCVRVFLPASIVQYNYYVMYICK